MRLRMARAYAGIDDATAAATRFGWTVSTYQSHENGNRGIKPTVAKKYAKAYKVSFTWLMTGEGTMTGPSIDAELMELPAELNELLSVQFRGIIAAAKSKPRGKLS